MIRNIILNENLMGLSLDLHTGKLIRSDVKSPCSILAVYDNDNSIWFLVEDINGKIYEFPASSFKVN